MNARLVGGPRIAEVRHLVVHEEAGTRDDHGRAELLLDRARDRHRVAVTVDDRYMRGRAAAALDGAGAVAPGARERDVAAPAVRVGLGGQRPGGDAREARVAEVAAAVGPGDLLGLGHEVQRVGRAGAEAREVIGLEEVEHLDDRQPAGAGRRHRHEARAVEGSTQRGAPLRAIARQVAQGQHAPVALQPARPALVLHDVGGGEAAVEGTRALPPDAVERAGERGLPEHRPGPVGAMAADEELGARVGEELEARKARRGSRARRMPEAYQRGPDLSTSSRQSRPTHSLRAGGAGGRAHRPPGRRRSRAAARSAACADPSR